MSALKRPTSACAPASQPTLIKRRCVSAGSEQSSTWSVFTVSKRMPVRVRRVRRVSTGSGANATGCGGRRVTTNSLATPSSLSARRRGPRKSWSRLESRAKWPFAQMLWISATLGAPAMRGSMLNTRVRTKGMTPSFACQHSRKSADLVRSVYIGYFSNRTICAADRHARLTLAQLIRVLASLSTFLRMRILISGARRSMGKMITE
jgi:hypothetical protein